MPNLVGIFDPFLSAHEAGRAVAAQFRRVRFPGLRYEEYAFTSAGLGLGLMDHGYGQNGRQPIISEGGRTVFLFDGELHNAAELRARFHKDLPADKLSTPELCFHLVRQKGLDVAREFDGLFGFALYESAARRLTLVADRYGFFPIYYVVRENCLIFGSEMKALCVVDPGTRQIDEHGTLELFTYGNQVMGRTSLRGYVRLPPATILTFDANGVQQTREYWRYRYDESAKALDQPSYYTHLAVLVDRAVERRMHGCRRVGIFLSGGYDSRAVAAAIRPCHRPIPAITFGRPESRDVRFAALLAERLGLEHHVLNYQTPYLFPTCRSIVWRTEGMLPFSNTTSIHFHSFLRQKLDVFLTGFLAEFSGSHVWPRLLLTRSRKQAIRVLFEHITGENLGGVQRIFQTKFLREKLPVLRERYERSCEQIQDEHPQNLADSWRFRFSQTMSTWQSTSIDRHVLLTRAPLLDHEVVDFQLSIPPWQRLEQRVYKRMIAYSYPDIRDVPCTNTERPINPHFTNEYVRLVFAFLGRKSVAPLRRLFPLRESLGRELRDVDADFRAEARLVDEILRPMLRAGIFPDEIFNRSGIESLIHDHYERGARHSLVLARLISWGLGIKYFLRDDFGDVPAEMFAP